MLYYDVTLSYVTMDDHVTVSMVTSMNSSTITELPYNTQVNITVTAIGTEQVILSTDSTTVITAAFESMYMYILQVYYFNCILLLHIQFACQQNL